jgi:hypothetical protein
MLSHPPARPRLSQIFWEMGAYCLTACVGTRLCTLRAESKLPIKRWFYTDTVTLAPLCGGSSNVGGPTQAQTSGRRQRCARGLNVQWITHALYRASDPLIGVLITPPRVVVTLLHLGLLLPSSKDAVVVSAEKLEYT